MPAPIAVPGDDPPQQLRGEQKVLHPTPPGLRFGNIGEGSPHNSFTGAPKKSGFMSPSSFLRQNTVSPLAWTSKTLTQRASQRARRRGRDGTSLSGATRALDDSAHNGYRVSHEDADVDMRRRSGEGDEQELTEWLYERLSDPAYSHMFGELAADDLKRLAARMSFVRVEAGETLIREGEAHPETCYIVGSGSFDVLKRSRGRSSLASLEEGVSNGASAMSKYSSDEDDVQQVPVRTMGKGTLFGEIALLFDSPRTATGACACMRVGCVWVRLCVCVGGWVACGFVCSCALRCLSGAHAKHLTARLSRILSLPVSPCISLYLHVSPCISRILSLLSVHENPLTTCPSECSRESSHYLPFF